MTDRADDLMSRGETRELGIFVPAIMSAGLIFSGIALLQDALHRRRRTARHRRLALTTSTSVEELRTERCNGGALRPWLRPRAAYLSIGVAGVAGGILLAWGATANYFRDDGYLEHIAWLLALSWVAAVFSFVVGIVAGVVFVSWPNPPRFTTGVLVRTPLSRRPSRADVSPVLPRLSLGTAWSVAVLVVLAVTVGALPWVVSGTDTRFANAIASWSVPDVVRSAARVGDMRVVLVATIVAVGFGWRCLVYAVAYLGAVAGAFLAGFALEELVNRSQPLGVFLTGTTTFPSVSIAQAVVIAGLLPGVLLIVFRSRWPAAGAGVVLVIATACRAIVEVHDRRSWPTDVLGGALLGVAFVTLGWWLILHCAWHRPCRSCRWMPQLARLRHHGGLIDLSDEWSRALQRGGIAWALIVAASLFALGIRLGVPSPPEGDMLLPEISGPLQIGLLILLALGALLSFRAPAVGATVLVLAGTGLAVLSAAQYPPRVAVAISILVLVPAVAIWSSWQRHATAERIWAVALVATLLLSAGFVGADRVYASLFGPTNPESTLALRPVDRVEWAWSGGVASDRATVVARLVHSARRARLEVTPANADAPLRTTVVAVPDNRIVRLEAAGLTPDTPYRWSVVVNGHRDTERGVGRLRTPSVGAQDLTIVAGSCARTGSNATVWDTMREMDPDLVLLNGDLHYQNIDENEVDAFLAAYDRVLTQPAPAALLRSAPAAYLWDDHDYGPNDADAASPSRPAARAAYRASVPYADLGPSGPPAQAFTIGRVRVIITDERSQRTPETMLGDLQLEWFLNELTTASRTHGLVVWVNSVPWIGDARRGADYWAAYPDERRRIADVIADAHIRNLVMVAGDAHMVAIDDGSHSDYSQHGGGGFPVFHAGAIDRPGGRKGGPYSEGAVPGGGQFGVLRIHDDGTNVRVTMVATNWKRERLLRFEFAVPGAEP